MSERTLEAALERGLERIESLEGVVSALRERASGLEQRVAQVEKREELLEFPDAAGDAPT
ncbi:MAG: hypothetical protein GWM92_04300 [Gemmatimonadetes bacterium]|nr:hypothetical protein [Gemmatimonadota bacterium]NIR77784.1 hypothetical protein [Gemmatimonadota bacterium]NIT86324.1 hypothetical protein [Gemmatimonadota bacterium]NIU30157.1 hypothetical protein [Gemmatimonadota bacterium]NIU35091.1 hypothetical protein [Gemmatimonadota bacterium]